MSGAPTTAAREAHSARHIGFKKAAILVAVAFLATLALVLRFYRLGALSLWSDEGISAAFTSLDWYNFLRILWRREANMALYYLLLRAWAQGGNSEAWLRSFSVLASAATVPLLWLLGRRLFGEAVGLASALLLALHAYHLQYAQEARSYSLVTLLVTASMYFFVRAVENQQRRDWNWYVATGSLAIYAHFFAVLVVVAQGISLCVRNPSFESSAGKASLGLPAAPISTRSFRQAARRIALWTLPVWLFIGTTGAGPVAWVPRPRAADLHTFADLFAGSGGEVLLALCGLCTLLGAIATARRLVGVPGKRGYCACRSGAGRSKESWSYALVLAWFAVPVLISLAFSLARPVFYPRFLLVALPGLVLLVTLGLFSLRPRWTAVPVLALMAWLAWGGVRHYFRNFGKEDLRGAAHYVLSGAEPGDAIVFYKPQSRFVYSYYADRSGRTTRPVIVFPGHGDRPAWRDFMPKFLPQTFSEAARNYRRVWLILTDDPASGGEPRARQIQALVASRDRLLARHDFAGVYVFLYTK
jgi:mannosyltransferase